MSRLKFWSTVGEFDVPTTGIRLTAWAALTCAGLTVPLASQADSEPPQCRLESGSSKLVEDTLSRAAAAFSRLGKPLPFDRVVFNPKSRVADGKTLQAYIVSDASSNSVGKDGCVKGGTAMVAGETLDEVSVRGGCLASSDALEIRCSTSAVRLFGKMAREGRANPALLYVLAHELGHIRLGRAGEYQGRVERLNLGASAEAKLSALKKTCDPADTAAEEDADKLATEVLAALLPQAPYREAVFSEQGSVLWGMDQLNLAANEWRKLALERECISQPNPHPSFLATEFPTPAAKVQSSAKRFVCEVLTKKSGTVLYPGKSVSHPPLEERMSKVAEALKPIAASRPRTGAQQEYRSIAVMQEQLSAIFSHIYRENGAYLEAVQSAVCTRVNGDKPMAGCK